MSTTSEPKESLNRYLNGLYPDFPAEKYRDCEAMKVTGRYRTDRPPSHCYREEILLLWAFWCYVTKDFSSNGYQIVIIEGRPRNRWTHDWPEGVDSSSVQVAWAHHMNPTVIGEIVYRAIWGKDGNLPVEDVLSYVTYEGREKTYTKLNAECVECDYEEDTETGQSRSGRKYWVKELKDAYAAWYQCGGRLQEGETPKEITVVRLSGEGAWSFVRASDLFSLEGLYLLAPSELKGLPKDKRALAIERRKKLVEEYTSKGYGRDDRGVLIEIKSDEGEKLKKESLELEIEMESEEAGKLKKETLEPKSGLRRWLGLKRGVK